MQQILKVAAIAAVTFGIGAAALAAMNQDIPDLEVPAGAWSDTGTLDGLSFKIYGTDVGSGAVLEDALLFQDGKFQSVDCQQYCEFGWSEYQTMEVDGVIHFTGTALCPDAPHTIVWYGTVQGDDIESDVTWTTRRWYWTHQIRLEATGSIAQTEDVSS